MTTKRKSKGKCNEVHYAGTVEEVYAHNRTDANLKRIAEDIVGELLLVSSHPYDRGLRVYVERRRAPQQYCGGGDMRQRINLWWDDQHRMVVSPHARNLKASTCTTIRGVVSAVKRALNASLHSVQDLT